ncbi:MAG: hypothetical protein ABI679_12465 [Gemmatimonadota bacterium]
MHRFTRSVYTALLASSILGPSTLFASDQWESLGTRRVNLAAETDVIEVPSREGRFDAIRIDVDAGTVEMYNVRVVFANGEDFSPDTRLIFRDGDHSRIIDLPGNDRQIRRISFHYKAQRRSGNAIVRVFGRKIAGDPRPVPGAEKGWDRIGSREVDFRVDHDAIPAAFEGTFRQIMIRVDGGDVEMLNVKVNFANGESFSPDTRLVFQNETRTRVIDLPGTLRVIRNVEFTYRSIRGGREGKAVVSVYGRK